VETPGVEVGPNHWEDHVEVEERREVGSRIVYILQPRSQPPPHSPGCSDGPGPALDCTPAALRNIPGRDCRPHSLPAVAAAAGDAGAGDGLQFVVAAAVWPCSAP